MAKSNVTHLRDPENHDGNSPRNPIRAFMLATQKLSGCCFCDDASHQHGRDVLAVLAQRGTPRRNSQLSRYPSPTPSISWTTSAKPGSARALRLFGADALRTT